MQLEFKKENEVSKFIKTHTFRILNTYLDEHPLDCYMKLCSLLNYPVQKDDIKIFTLSYAHEDSKINTLFYKPINILNKKVLQQ